MWMRTYRHRESPARTYSAPADSRFQPDRRHNLIAPIATQPPLSAKQQQSRTTKCQSLSAFPSPLFGFRPPDPPVAAHHTAFGGTDNPVAALMGMSQANGGPSQNLAKVRARCLAESEQPNTSARSPMSEASERRPLGRSGICGLRDDFKRARACHRGVPLNHAGGAGVNEAGRSNQLRRNIEILAGPHDLVNTLARRDRKCDGDRCERMSQNRRNGKLTAHTLIGKIRETVGFLRCPDFLVRADAEERKIAERMGPIKGGFIHHHQQLRTSWKPELDVLRIKLYGRVGDGQALALKMNLRNRLDQL